MLYKLIACQKYHNRKRKLKPTPFNLPELLFTIAFYLEDPQDRAHLARTSKIAYRTLRFPRLQSAGSLGFIQRFLSQIILQDLICSQMPHEKAYREAATTLDTWDDGLSTWAATIFNPTYDFQVTESHFKPHIPELALRQDYLHLLELDGFHGRLEDTMAIKWDGFAGVYFSLRSFFQRSQETGKRHRQVHLTMVNKPDLDFNHKEQTIQAFCFRFDENGALLSRHGHQQKWQKVDTYGPAGLEDTQYHLLPGATTFDPFAVPPIDEHGQLPELCMFLKAIQELSAKPDANVFPGIRKLPKRANFGDEGVCDYVVYYFFYKRII